MSRTPRHEMFRPDEIKTVHVMNRVTRRCFLLGQDPLTQKNYDHRKNWIEVQLRRVAACFGIDLLVYAILSNHFHLVLRSRPDVVKTWDDREVARRWYLLCPERKESDGSACEPNEWEINSIANDPDAVVETRSRLSDISWWMRLVCQNIAQRANAEDEQTGKFWESRFKAVCLLDEAAILACAAYVDLNPIRAAIAELLELSDHTSIQLRLEVIRALAVDGDQSVTGLPATGLSVPGLPVDAHLAPVEIDELHDETGAVPSQLPTRCSDKGFLPMPMAAYVELLNWTAQQTVLGTEGKPESPLPPIFERLKIDPEVWCKLVSEVGQMFCIVAGKPEAIDKHRSSGRGHRFHMPARTRELLSV